MIRWGSVITGFVIGAALAWLRTSGGGSSGASGDVPPTDQMKRAGWST